MRRVSFLLLFLLVGSLAVVTAPVRAETTQYYALSFDGVDDYMSTNYQFTGSFTVVWIGKIKSDEGRQYIFNNGNDGSYASNSDGTWAYYYNGYMKFYIVEQNVSKKVISYQFDKINQSVMITCVYDEAANTMKLYEDTELKAQRNDAVLTPSTRTTTYFASYSSTVHNSAEDIYVILIYSRALSDGEIQAIYNDPLHPPTDGLVLFYAPDSVDTAQNKWLDKSGHGNDGTIVGASYVPLRPVSESTPSASAPYGLYFDGDDYVDTSASVGGANASFTIVALVRRAENGGWDIIVSQKEALTNNKALHFGYRPNNYFTLAFYGDDLNYPALSDVGKTILWAGVYDGTSNEQKLYRNGQLVAQRTASEDFLGTNATIRIGEYAGYYFNGNVYLVLIYNRALSDSEIRQIYENPENPPLDGLVLWYDPYSYDPVLGKWLNRAPIFPTIPLAEELDAVNYGATPERVSIPSLHVYDIENNSEIPVENVSVSLIANNTTISLIPSLLTLPWNSTVTLNVSATNYLPRLLQTPTSITSLAVYLYPASSENSTTTLPNWTNNFTMPDVNGSWSGWQVGKEALSLNFDKAIQLFFTQNPNSKAQVFLPFAIWLGMTVLGLVFSQSPLVALTLGVITQASLAGLGAKLDMRLLPGVVTLYLFLFIWILKDFIESRKAD